MIFTGALVVVGFIQFLAMMAQAYWMARTVKVGETAAGAAKKSADAVVSQLWAYLSMRVKEGIPPTFDAVTGPYFAFEITNTGQTPAFKMDYWIRGAIGPVDSDGPFPGGEDDVPPHEYTLSPGAKTDVSTSGPAPEPGVAAAFENGQLAAYAWGEINYIDAFKNERFYKFRYTFTAQDIAGPIVHIRLCQNGNEAN